MAWVVEDRSFGPRCERPRAVLSEDVVVDQLDLVKLLLQHVGELSVVLSHLGDPSTLLGVVVVVRRDVSHFLQKLVAGHSAAPSSRSIVTNVSSMRPRSLSPRRLTYSRMIDVR